ncbi:CDC45 family [Phyllosticta capitalensis]|uniref:CDC45 family n=1 Tax=Phyllosticta capitalensis TaxID=121624 RepID=UPI00313122F1
MYLPRSLIAHLYTHLLHSTHPLSSPALLLVSLEPDALCACRILTALLKRDYIPHKIQPISGYNDLARAGQELVRPMRTTDGGSGGVVICLGVGGLVDLESLLGLEEEASGANYGGVEIWLMDARRPWNLSNVFGGRGDSLSGEDELPTRIPGLDRGRISRMYKPGKGGIVVFDDGDVDEEMEREREAYCALEQMPELGDDDLEDEESDQDEGPEDEVPTSGQAGRKRKAWDDEEETEDEGRPAQRRRSNSSSPIPSSPTRPPRRGLAILGHSSDFSRSDSIARSSPPLQIERQPSAKTLRRRLLKLRAQHNKVLEKYYSLGTSYSEPISSIVYSLASELGREDNDLLWQAIVGVSSLELYGRTPTGLGLTSSQKGWHGSRGDQIRALLQDEVRRLNPVDLKDITREANLGESGGVIPTHARSPTDNSIRLSPEPRFLLIRHWSLYDSMLHSPYLGAKLHIWTDNGRRRLHKMLAKMGVSLSQCRQNYTHMDMDLKRDLRQKLLHFAPVYGMDGLVPGATNRGAGKEGWGFVRCWGWKACLSAIDVAVVLGAILEVGSAINNSLSAPGSSSPPLPPTPKSLDSQSNQNDPPKTDEEAIQDAVTSRFWLAYDALTSPNLLTQHVPIAQNLHRAILRTGTALIAKQQLRHLRAFRMTIVKDGPDVPLFVHPGALVKLALWLQEAVQEMEGKRGKSSGSELVIAGLDEPRGVYVVVGLGGGGTTVQSKEKEKRRAEKLKQKQEKREARRLEKAERKQREIERRLANGEDVDEDEEDIETEEEDSSESESEEEGEEVDQRKGAKRNRFGIAFQEVIEETGARVKVDSFDHCVVEVRKEDLSGFLEQLSLKAIVG